MKLSPEASDAIKWTGAVSRAWSNAANWEPNQVPTANDNVFIPANAVRLPKSKISGACKNLAVAEGAKLIMTGGTLDVYGSLSAPSSDCFDFEAGTVILNKGHVLPDNMTFDYLTFMENFDNPTKEYNTYEMHGNITVNGSLTLSEIDSGVLYVNMHFRDTLVIMKDFRSIGGTIGGDILDDQILTPIIVLAGTTEQILRVDGWIEAAIKIINPDVLLKSNLVIFSNLFLYAPFDIQGKTLIVTNKIFYKTPQAGIANSRPTKGYLSIWGAKDTTSTGETVKVTVKAFNRISYVDLVGEDTIQLETNLSADTLVILSCLDLNGHNLSIGKTINSKGFLDCYNEASNNLLPIVNTGSSGTLSLLGNAQCPRYNLTATGLFNFSLNSPSGVELNNPLYFDEILQKNLQERLTLNGTAVLNKGNFDYKQTHISIPAGGKIKETPGNIFYGHDTSDIIYINPKINTASKNLNLGGTGVIVTTNNLLDSVRVDRWHFQPTGLNNNKGIFRLYSFFASGNSLAASLQLKYDESELDGIDEANLGIFTSVDGETWTAIPSTVNIATNTVTATGTFQKFEGLYYALGDVFSPLRKEQPIKNEEAIIAAGGLVLYPNPASDKLHLVLSNNADEAYLEIFDLLGKSLISKSVRSDSYGVCTEDIDIQHLAKGVYIVRISGEAGVTTGKLVKE